MRWPCCCRPDFLHTVREPQIVFACMFIGLKIHLDAHSAPSLIWPARISFRNFSTSPDSHGTQRNETSNNLEWTASISQHSLILVPVRCVHRSHAHASIQFRIREACQYAACMQPAEPQVDEIRVHDTTVALRLVVLLIDTIVCGWYLATGRSINYYGWSRGGDELDEHVCSFSIIYLIQYSNQFSHRISLLPVRRCYEIQF